MFADVIAISDFARRIAAYERPTARRHLREFAFHAFVLVATLPLLLLAAVDNQVTAAKQEADGSGRLREAVAALSDHIDSYVSNHVQAVQSLTVDVRQPKLDSADRQQLLTEYHKVYPGFITLFVADRTGVVREIYPTRSTSPTVSDREYFIEAMRTKKTGDFRRDPRTPVTRADRHDRRARCSTTTARSPASSADRWTSRSSNASSKASARCRTRASPSSTSTIASSTPAPKPATAALQDVAQDALVVAGTQAGAE